MSRATSSGGQLSGGFASENDRSSARNPLPALEEATLVQGVANTLADRLGAALAERAGTADDGGRLRIALEEVRVGAITDSGGTIHRRRDDR